MHTPWGAAQHQKTIAPGIVRVDTASHGGYLLNAEALAAMPAALRAIVPFAGRGAYEEDCDWAIVALAFPQHFDDYAILAAVETTMSEFGEPKAQGWLVSTTEGLAVLARAEAFKTTNAAKFRQGSAGTAGKGWSVSARDLQGKVSIEIHFDTNDYYNLPRLFDEADIARCGGTITERRTWNSAINRFESQQEAERRISEGMAARLALHQGRTA